MDPLTWWWTCHIYMVQHFCFWEEITFLQTHCWIRVYTSTMRNIMTMRFAGISSMSLVLFIWKIKFISKVDWEAILGMSSVHKRRIKSICHRTCPLQKVTELSNCNTGLDDIQELAHQDVKTMSFLTFLMRYFFRFHGPFHFFIGSSQYRKL